MSTVMPASTFKHASQVDEPTFSASDLKAYLDIQAEEIIAWFNATHIGTDKIHIGDNPAARVYHDAAQSINTATNTSLAFNSERYDNDTMHDTVTNNSRITCKTAGKYLITGHVVFASNATGIRAITVRLNGTTNIASVYQNTINGVSVRMSIATQYSLAVNDYIELVVYQDSGGALNVSAVGNESPEFGMVRVG